MKRVKKQRLERAGWVVGDSAQFLQLSVEENRFIELKLALATGVRELRERKGLTQAALAHRLGSSQSRVAKMEAADSLGVARLDHAIASHHRRHRHRHCQMDQACRHCEG